MRTIISLTARRGIFLLIALFALPSLFSLHEKEMVERGYPVPPPTVDPGAEAATLRVVIKDRDTEEIISAVVSVNDGAQEPEENPLGAYSLRRAANRHKGPLRFRELDYYFYTVGSFSVRVPPGRCKIEVSKGYEYRPVERIVHLQERGSSEVVIYLQRWIDMASRGWYSGDLHLHLERTGENEETLFSLTSAKDIQYGFLLSMNTRGYDRGRDFESWSQAFGLGDQSARRKGRYHLSSGQEYRPGALGHVSILLSDDYVPAHGRSENVSAEPSLALIADQAHTLDGFIGLIHGGYDHREADRLGLEGKMDFLELLQFGGYRGLGLDGWYDFLNLGYRWPIVGSSDFPYTRELGDCLTYVSSKREPSPRAFVEGVSAGESFVTSGPMLFLEVDGKGPGSLLRYPAEGEVRLRVRVQVLSPLYPVRYVEIIQNGRIVERKFAPAGKTYWEFADELPLDESGWVAARAYGDAGTDAHTNPVFQFRGGKRPFSRDACDQILARLAGSIRTIPNPAIVRELEEIAIRLQAYRDQGDATGLALPDLP